MSPKYDDGNRGTEPSHVAVYLVVWAVWFSKNHRVGLTDNPVLRFSNFTGNSTDNKNASYDNLRMSEGMVIDVRDLQVADIPESPRKLDSVGIEVLKSENSRLSATRSLLQSGSLCKGTDMRWQRTANSCLQLTCARQFEVIRQLAAAPPRRLVVRLREPCKQKRVAPRKTMGLSV